MAAISQLDLHFVSCLYIPGHDLPRVQVDVDKIVGLEAGVFAVGHRKSPVNAPIVTDVFYSGGDCLIRICDPLQDQARLRTLEASLRLSHCVLTIPNSDERVSIFIY